MSTLSAQLIVDAPADSVWDVVGRRFDRIGDWATAIPASTALAPPTDRTPMPPDAPVAGRVCRTGVRLAPTVTEILVAYDDARRTLTYEGSGLPSFVVIARNTWTVTPLDADRCRATLDAEFTTRGLLGRLAGRVLLARVGRTSRHLAEDLRHYVETGEPSPRKQRQLRRSPATGS